VHRNTAWISCITTMYNSKVCALKDTSTASLRALVVLQAMPTHQPRHNAAWGCVPPALLSRPPAAPASPQGSSSRPCHRQNTRRQPSIPQSLQNRCIRLGAWPSCSLGGTQLLSQGHVACLPASC
jgi:hypothetical protein